MATVSAILRLVNYHHEVGAVGATVDGSEIPNNHLG